MTVSILVVDDESDVAELFRQRFRREVRQGTYTMHFANSGVEALEKLAGGIEPTLIVILSDINMPGMDGLTLLREIKARQPDLPVMMVTAYGDDERRRRGRGVRRRAVHHQAGRFRPAEGAVAGVAQRGGLRITNPDRTAASRVFAKLWQYPVVSRERHSCFASIRSQAAQP